MKSNIREAKRTTLLAAALAMAVIIATASPALARRDPGAGTEPASSSGMGLYNYGPRPPAQPRIGQAGLNNQHADGMNLYQYVKSNPVKFVDPSGLFTAYYTPPASVRSTSTIQDLTGTASDGLYGRGTADAVVDAQRAMRDAGFYSGAIDGKWGPQTDAAWTGFVADGKSRSYQVFAKLRSACEKYWCKADTGCTMAKCKEEARAIADAYVKMYDTMANSATSYGQKNLGTQNTRDVHSGWMCYHWRTHTYNATLPKQGKCIKIGKSGSITAGSGSVTLVHNWVVATVGKQAKSTGDCTRRLDPWLNRSPKAYTDSEHGFSGNFLSTTPNTPGSHTGTYTAPDGTTRTCTFGENWGNTAPYSP